MKDDGWKTLKEFLYDNLQGMRMVNSDAGHPEILDELCHCGHYGSHHAVALQRGQGACLLCDCPQFTWDGFLVKQAIPPAKDPKPPVPKICPLLHISACLSPTVDHEPGLCEGDECAWWTHGQCSMVTLSAGLEVIDIALKHISGHLHVIAEHTGGG